MALFWLHQNIGMTRRGECMDDRDGNVEREKYVCCVRVYPPIEYTMNYIMQNVVYRKHQS